MDSPSLYYEAVHHLGLASLFGLSPLLARQKVLCSNAGRLGLVCSPAIGMSYPPLLLGACLKLSEASGISAQKERRAGEVGAGAGERFSRSPGAARPPQGMEPAWRTWLRVGCRRDRRPGICRSGCLPSDPGSQCRAGWEGSRGRSGSAGTRGTLAWRLRAAGKELRSTGSRRTKVVKPVLEAVIDSRVGPHCSALHRRQRRDLGPWGGGGARSCGGRGLSPVFVQLGSRSTTPWVT